MRLILLLLVWVLPMQAQACKVTAVSMSTGGYRAVMDAVNKFEDISSDVLSIQKKSESTYLVKIKVQGQTRDKVYEVKWDSKMCPIATASPKDT